MGQREGERETERERERERENRHEQLLFLFPCGSDKELNTDKE